MKRTILALCLVGSAMLAFADEVRLDRSTVLHFQSHPLAAFVVEVSPEPDALPSVKLSYEGGNPRDDISINLHMLKVDPAVYGEESFRVAVLRRYCEIYVDNSIEKQVSIQRYVGSNGAEVFYCAFTDPSLAENESYERGKFKNAVAALAVNGDYEFTALGLLNGLNTEHEKTFLQTMSSFRIQDGT